VKTDTKHAAIVVIAAVVVMAAIFIGVSVASGVSPPQTVVESGSMQHGQRSHIGTIDTGDMVILKNKNKLEIRSYVDGYNTGYERFGSYGDVIIYNRTVGNPVIHRAILWLDYNGDGTWSAPSLEKYPADRWSCTGGSDYNRLSGSLTLKGMGSEKNLTVSLSLDRLVMLDSGSGFITMGDNNRGFDQPDSVAGVKGLISYEQIRSVAWFEIPWAGVLKMAWNGKLDVVNTHAPNSVPSLIAATLLMIFLLIGISFLFDQRYYMKYEKELAERINAPAPLFPVENEEG